MKLQNNYTTPEQSKRLLELGVPADSADCYYYTSIDRKPKIRTSNKPVDYTCWSVGRLIEIYELCVGERFERRADMSTLQLKPIMQDILEQYQERVKSIYRHMDFSKLED